MNGHDTDHPTGAADSDPLLAELRTARPEPPPELLSPQTGPNRALVEEIIMQTHIETVSSPAPRRQANRRRIGLLVGAVAATAVAFGVATVVPWGTEESAADAMIRDAVVATRAALNDTGRATTSVLLEPDSDRSERNVTLWEFAGADERYYTEDGGYENRIVDGENYVLGFNSRHPEQWYRVQCNEGIQRSTPDPRSLVSALSPAADFETVGQERVGGVQTTHLRARNPEAIAADAIVGETAEEVVTAFDVWVDGDNVARRIEADVESTAEVIDDRTGEEVTTGAEWTIELSDLGDDIVISAPAEFEDETCEGA